MSSFQNFCRSLSVLRVWLSAQLRLRRKQFHFPVLPLHPKPFPQVPCWLGTSHSPRGKVFPSIASGPRQKISRWSLETLAQSEKLLKSLQQALPQTSYHLGNLWYISLYLLFTYSLKSLFRSLYMLCHLLIWVTSTKHTTLTFNFDREASKTSMTDVRQHKRNTSLWLVLRSHMRLFQAEIHTKRRLFSVAMFLNVFSAQVQATEQLSHSFSIWIRDIS